MVRLTIRVYKMVLIENSKCIATCAACGAPEEVLVLHLGPLFEFPDGVLQDSPSSLWQTASW